MASNPDCGTPRGGGGFVICRNGRKISCASFTLPGVRDPNNPMESIFRQCIIEHEDTHHDDVNCQDCGTASVCRPNFAMGSNPGLQECIAYIASVGCLIRNRDSGACGGNAECEEELDSFIRRMCGVATTQCGGARPSICGQIAGW